MIIQPANYPDCLKGHPELQGVFVGGCVARGEGSRFRHKAHAHNSGEHKGWICILSARRLECKELLLHELAHLISGCGHTDKWRKVLLELGGTLDVVFEKNSDKIMMRDYHKRIRKGECKGGFRSFTVCGKETTETEYNKVVNKQFSRSVLHAKT